MIATVKGVIEAVELSSFGTRNNDAGDLKKVNREAVVGVAVFERQLQGGTAGRDSKRGGRFLIYTLLISPLLLSALCPS